MKKKFMKFSERGAKLINVYICVLYKFLYFNILREYFTKIPDHVIIMVQIKKFIKNEVELWFGLREIHKITDCKLNLYVIILKFSTTFRIIHYKFYMYSKIILREIYKIDNK